jgi:hypothetical protein
MPAAIKSYAQSLIWVVLYLTIASIASVIVGVMLLDFVHDLPYRSRDNAIFILTFATPILAVSTIIVSFLVFAPSQFFQAVILGGSDRLFGQTRFLVLQTLPLTAVLTWYCYDYLTPADIKSIISESRHLIPHQHGLTTSRYMMTLAIQAPITLFSFLYFETGTRGRSKKPILIAALAAAIAVGAIQGFGATQMQLRFP